MPSQLLEPTAAVSALPAAEQLVDWTQLGELGIARAIVSVIEHITQPALVVTRNSAQAERLVTHLNLFLPELSVQQFPDWETLPYDAFSPHSDIVSARLAALRALSGDQAPAVLVVPIQTLLQRIAPRAHLAGHTLELAIGSRFDAQAHRVQLEGVGYQHVETVAQHGEYALRGSLMDIYPAGLELPVRIDLFDDEIETLRYFDPETQRTVQSIDALNLIPAKEFPFDEAAVRRFRERWHNTFDVDVRRCPVYQDVSSGLPPAGIEYYLPFFYDSLDTLFDYLPETLCVFEDVAVQQAAERFWDDVKDRYENLCHDIERPILAPRELFVSLEEWYSHRKTARVVRWHDLTTTTTPKHAIAFNVQPVPEVAFQPRAQSPTGALQEFIGTTDVPVLLTADTAGRKELLQEQLHRAGLQPTEVADWQSFQSEQPELAITSAVLNRSALFSDCAIVSETQIVGAAPTSAKPTRGGRVIDPEQMIRNLTELRVGAPVVHIEHGVGRYQGLSTLEIDGAAHEFLTLSYAEDAKLYVPVTSLHLISRYTGADDELAPLHRLGSEQWSKAKQKAAERAVDVAAELLDIYARRAARTSRAFQQALEDGRSDYERFVAQFEYELTPDQATAIDAVIADLAAPQATDRLICGDVGFGKTEVAMRAAYIAVAEGAQVAVLVPTTLLAQQHGDTFRDRFADWPVRIEVVSRLRTDAEVEQLSTALSKGKIDIVIGTHKLLSPDFKFKDLGLVVIDEEHRFGVRQKERLKALRAEVDVLTLTATPIPRTLNLAMSGLRELSIIATPPAKRLAIKTFVQQQNNGVIKDAITRELMRGGQVFYLHNEVRTIEETARKLQEMLPEARIGIGHGQMATRALEQVMSDFYHRRTNVLVCTTIIETGIDIPNANTIIIERADKLGLAQLHQLRGRVGRSTRQAYAYLLTPHPKALTADAVKRLEAVEAAGELGIGFTLATHDMEIRGAGEVLGDEQSGQIESVGFALYMRMLERAVAALKAGDKLDINAPLEPVSQEVNLHAPALIPDDYLPDVDARLILYKRISRAADSDALDALMVEMIDRFGLLPEATKRLFIVTRVKLAASRLGITRIDLGERNGRLEFSETTSVDPLVVIKLMQNQPSTFRLDGATLLRTTKELPDFEDRVQFIEQLLLQLAPATTNERATA